MPFEYRFPRPALTVDCVVFDPNDDGLRVLLVERGEEPYRGDWATPGGFVEIDESVSAAAGRELDEEVGLQEVGLEAFDVFGAPGRDPRGRVVSVAHVGLVDGDRRSTEASSDAADCQWFDLEAIPDLAFDHDDILGGAVDYLRRRARTGPVGRNLLNGPFAFERIASVYTSILGGGVDSEQLFERLVHRTGVLRASDGTDDPTPDDGPFEFVPEAYDRMRNEPESPWID